VGGLAHVDVGFQSTGQGGETAGVSYGKHLAGRGRAEILGRVDDDHQVVTNRTGHNVRACLIQLHLTEIEFHCALLFGQAGFTGLLTQNAPRW
jgi:hypothetical protein